MNNKKPYVVYYLHYKDEYFMERNFSKNQDYCTCVMANDYEEAISKTYDIVNKYFGESYIKIMGVSMGLEEWVNEYSPLSSGDNIMPLGGFKK